jgi:hypothetical protein
MHTVCTLYNRNPSISEIDRCDANAADPSFVRAVRWMVSLVQRAALATSFVARSASISTVPQKDLFSEQPK